MNYVVRQFGQPTGAFGMLAGWIMANRPSNISRNEWTAALIDPASRDRVLEIGCGPGIALSKICARVREGKVVAIDHSALMIRQAAARNRDAIAAGLLELRHGGLELLPELGAKFDSVYSVNVAMFWGDKRAAFESIAEVVRPGGTVATTYQPRHRGATSADAFAFAAKIGRMMEETGFAAIRNEVLPLNPLPAICVLGTAH
jgi:SAM-dependent methyltransferase